MNRTWSRPTLAGSAPTPAQTAPADLSTLRPDSLPSRPGPHRLPQVSIGRDCARFSRRDFTQRGEERPASLPNLCSTTNRCKFGARSPHISHYGAAYSLQERQAADCEPKPSSSQCGPGDDDLTVGLEGRNWRGEPAVRLFFGWDAQPRSKAPVPDMASRWHPACRAAATGRG